MNIKIQQRRATIFVIPQLNLSEDILPKFIADFSSLGLIPSVNKGLGIKITPQGIEPEEVISLDLKKLDDTLKVSFGPDRIDIVSIVNTETWDSFRDISMKIYGILKNDMNMQVNRLALCANFSCALNQGVGNVAYSKLTNLEEKPVEWQIRKVERSEIKTSDNVTAIINKVITISRNELVVKGEDLRDVLNMDYDINTLVGTNVEAINAIQELFWEESASLIEKNISSYKTIFESWQ